MTTSGRYPINAHIIIIIIIIATGKAGVPAIVQLYRTCANSRRWRFLSLCLYNTCPPLQTIWPRRTAVGERDDDNNNNIASERALGDDVFHVLFSRSRIRTPFRPSKSGAVFVRSVRSILFFRSFVSVPSALNINNHY